MKLGNAINTTDIIADTDFKVYPNPGKGLFTIQLDDFSVGNAYIQVFNSLGQMVSSIESQFSNKIEINLSDFESGVYYLKVTNNNGVHLKSIMINRWSINIREN